MLKIRNYSRAIALALILTNAVLPASAKNEKSKLIRS